MKKIDLHMHMVSTVWDAEFTFDLEALKHYVAEARLDAIAVTNHNTFDPVDLRRLLLPIT